MLSIQLELYGILSTFDFQTEMSSFKSFSTHTTPLSQYTYTLRTPTYFLCGVFRYRVYCLSFSDYTANASVTVSNVLFTTAAPVALQNWVFFTDILAPDTIFHSHQWVWCNTATNFTGQHCYSLSTHACFCSPMRMAGKNGMLVYHSNLHWGGVNGVANGFLLEAINTEMSAKLTVDSTRFPEVYFTSCSHR